jgi:hypothetical protein
LPEQAETVIAKVVSKRALASFIMIPPHRRQ